MDRDDLLKRYRATRALSLELCEPLKPEDYRIQSMPDVSPPWWNLGHTTWFFAKNVLEPQGSYTPDDGSLEFVLNSYYETHGPRIPRPERGLVTRPTTEEILEFRASVDRRVEKLIREAEETEFEELAFLVTVGVHHEQQHQELLITEVKHILGMNVREMREPYRDAPAGETGSDGVPAARFAPFEGGLYEFGNLEGGWCFDNELPVHKAYLQGFELLNRLITNQEYLEFMEDGGYEDPLLWLANGWDQVQEQGWKQPLYWEKVDGDWQVWALAGNRQLEPHEPVGHVSFYEADAFARWKSAADREWYGSRLPTEREWEHAARQSQFERADGNFLETLELHPKVACAGGDGPLLQAAGDLWEWTSNHYEPYPGYKPFDGDLMEYNGKFMDNQRVLRGGSCATPRSHIRVSYRNFWAPETQFQFSGIRLARTLE